MVAQIKSFTAFFCETCEKKEFVYFTPTKSGLVGSKASKIPPFSIKLSQIIAAIKSATQERISQGGAQLDYDEKTKELKVIGEVKEYKHNCAPKKSAQDAEQIDPFDIDWVALKQIKKFSES